MQFAVVPTARRAALIRLVSVDSLTNRSPTRVEQLRLGHDPLAVEPDGQDVEDLRLDVNRLPAPLEEEPVGVRQDLPEQNPHAPIIPPRPPTARGFGWGRAQRHTAVTGEGCPRPDVGDLPRSHLLGGLHAEQVEARRHGAAARAR